MDMKSVIEDIVAEEEEAERLQRYRDTNENTDIDKIQIKKKVAEEW